MNELRKDQKKSYIIKNNTVKGKPAEIQQNVS